MLNCQDAYRYDRWRQRWLSSLHSQAISLVCHHGLACALVLAPRLPTPDTATEPASVAPSNALLVYAASMSCQLIHSTRLAYAQTL